MFVLCRRNVSTLPRFLFNFTPIDKLSEKLPGDYVDVVGVVKDCEDSRKLMNRFGTQTVVRNLTLVDHTKTAVNVALFGKKAETFNPSGNPVIAVKNALIAEWNHDKVNRNPNFEEVSRLQRWWMKEGKDLNSDTITPLMIKEADIAPKQQVLNIDNAYANIPEDSKELFNVKAVILDVNGEDCVYKGCPSCKKKLPPTEVDGKYFCEPCDEYVYYRDYMRLKLDVNDAESTRLVSITMFEEVGKKLLGLGSQEIALLQNENENAFNDLFQSVCYKSYIFRCQKKSKEGEAYLSDDWLCYDVKTAPMTKEMEERLKDHSVRSFTSASPGKTKLTNPILFYCIGKTVRNY